MVVEIADLVDLPGLMPTGTMRTAITSILLILAFAAYSQKDYFIFINSDNQLPFFLKMGEKIYSSSAAGHIIIPKLADSVYTFDIGFAKEQSPARQFQVQVNKRDRGFQLKDMGEKGWALFDLQSLELIYPVNRSALTQTGYSLAKKDNGFARLMARVVNDTAVLYSVVYEKPVEKLAKAGTKNAVDTPAQQKLEQNQPVVQVEKSAKSPERIDMIDQHRSDSGMQIVFVDRQDSIRILIATDESPQKALVESKPVNDSLNGSTSLEKSPERKDQQAISKSPDSSMQNTTVSAKPDTAAKNPAKPDSSSGSTARKLQIYNSDCKAIAWEADVDKLRLKILAEKDVDNKIAIARKIFKTKCFTAAQIKALTELFVTDQDKYKFLDAAWPFALDTDNFKQLSYLLTDDYYVKRFRAMVRLD